jgi:hypothetical protein
VDGKEPFNDAAHYMPGYEKEAQQRIVAKLDEAVSKEKAGKHDEAMQALADGLHTVQDKSAHTPGGGWWKHIGAQAGVAKDPDAFETEPLNHVRAVKGSNEYLSMFLDRVRR